MNLRNKHSKEKCWSIEECLPKFVINNNEIINIQTKN